MTLGNYLCLSRKPPAPCKTVLSLYLLILDGCCARALLQWVRSVGSRLELRVKFESRAIYHADEPQFLSSFTSSFIPRAITSCI